MAEPCRSARATCVVDTLRDAVHATEFTTGARAGLVALGFTVVLGLVWWRVRPGARPLPIVGLAAVVPASFIANWLLYRIVLMPLVRRAKNQGMLEVAPLEMLAAIEATGPERVLVHT